MESHSGKNILAEVHVYAIHMNLCPERYQNIFHRNSIDVLMFAPFTSFLQVLWSTDAAVSVFTSGF